MKSLRVDAGGTKFLGQRFGAFSAQAIHDAALATMTVDELDDGTQFLTAGDIRQHVEPDVWSVEGSDKHLGLLDIELACDVLSREAVGGSGERHDGHRGKPLLEHRELGVFGPENTANMMSGVKMG